MNPIERALARADTITAAYEQMERANVADHTYTIVLDTPSGQHTLELTTFQGPEAAARRAHFTLVCKGYGDLDEITIVSVTAQGE